MRFSRLAVAVVSAAALLLLWAAGGLQCAPDNQQIAVRELLNQTYANELVTYLFRAPERACEVTSLKLTGPRGPQAVQLSAVDYWPDTKFVRSAQVSFLVDALTPLSTNDYTLAYAPSPGQTAVATDLAVKQAATSVEITTAGIAARFLLGEQTYAAPVALKDAPGPLQGLRLGNGAWSGGSRWYGEGALKAYAARLTGSGPVFARVEFLYTLAEGNTFKLTAQIVAGDNAIRWESQVARDTPGQGLVLDLGALPGVKEMVMPKGFGQWAKDRTLPLAASAEPACFLSPDTSLANIFPECPSTLQLVGDGGRELVLRSREPAIWADPVQPLTYAGFKTWDADAIPLMWENWKRNRLPVIYGADGTVSLRCTLVPGRRKWTTGAGAPRVGDRLNAVKDLVLDWPDKAGEHPRLFMSKAEVQESWQRLEPDPARLQFLVGVRGYLGWSNEAYLYSKGDKEVAAKAEIVKQMRDTLAKLGDFDTMRHAIALGAMYDTVIDTDLIAPQDKALFRAQMAYLAYIMADPTTWSMERGYLSGNPNMTCSYTLSLGVLACLLPDHPMAKTWSDYATAWMDKWLADEVGPNGEWIPEGLHYGQVSVTPMISYAVAAQKAGFHDFLTDPRLKRMALYFAQQWTPADPQRQGARVSPPVGRGTAGDTSALFGVLAKATAQSDPGFSKLMQWMWEENGYAAEFGDWRMGGFEPLYTDRRLPAQKPEWGSALFPNLGVILRNGTGGATENYVNLLTHDNSLRNLDVWVAEVGSLAQWYARGKPASEAFYFATGYNERHELLRDGVRLAHNWDGVGDRKGPFGYYTTTQPQACSMLPNLDYVRAAYAVTRPDDRDWFPDKLPTFPKVTPATAPKLDWTRQVLFLKDDDPAGANYLVFRDTVAGGQPTEWQFRSLSEKIGPPDAVRVPAFLEDKPGPAGAPARQLPPGDRYTAVGQFEVDLEYFIAAPTDTPRYTMRYGGARLNVPEYEDLLNLRLPGDGYYFVAIFPRGRAEEPPAFAALGEGKVIKVAGAFGTDYAFLTEQPANVKAEEATFNGTAGAVQARAAGLSLTLCAPGEVRYKQYGLVAGFPAGLRVAAEAMTVSLPPDGPGGPVTILAPAGWKLDRAAAGAKLETVAGGYRLTVPAGMAVVKLVK